MFPLSPVRVCSVSYFLSLLDFQLPLKERFPKAYKLLEFQKPFKQKHKQETRLLNCRDPPPPAPLHLPSTAKFLEKSIKAQCMYVPSFPLALPHRTVLTILVFLKNLFHSLFFYFYDIPLLLFLLLPPSIPINLVFQTHLLLKMLVIFRCRHRFSSPFTPLMGPHQLT